MSEIIKPPTKWAPLLDLSAIDLKNALGNQRLISIKSYIRNNKRVYAGIAVQDGISGLSWTGSMKYADLKQMVNQANGRLITLDAFWDTGANELRCAGAWIKNTQGWKWDFNVDMTPSAITGVLEKDKGKLTCLRVYTRPTNPQQQPPISFEEKYCAIWIQDDGHPWNWDPDIDPSALGLKLDDQDGRLVSIDSHAPNSGHVAAVWWKNDTGAVWFWNVGLDAAALIKEFPKFCSYGLDVVSAGTAQYASIMCQFPKKPDPNEASLIAFSGSGAVTLLNSLFESISWKFQQQNLTAASVAYKNAVMFAAAEGGWCWWSADFVNPAGQTIFGLPLTLAASGSYSGGGGWQVTNNPKFGVFFLRAEDGTGKHQELVAQAPLSMAGFPTPAKLSTAWPVFLGLQAPVESVKLTNGKTWVTVAGQICNGTNQILTITNVHVRLRDQSVILHEASFTGNLTIDVDNTGKFLSPSVVGPVVGSNAPLPKFYDGFAVPASFTSGKLKVVANVKFGGALDCYGDTRELTVVPAPVTTMAHLPYGAAPSTPFAGLRWHWGNGVGGTGFNAHSTPEHRYCYDIVIWDAQNHSLKPGGDQFTNKDFYCWSQPILAMGAGTVIFVDDSNDDNKGRGGNVNNNSANMVVVQSLDKKLYYVYVHLHKGGALNKNNQKVKVGDSVNAGDKIGEMGNTGDSSEPHLHVGIYTLDANGFLRSLPMSFNKIKDGSGNVVSGVPADDNFYSS